ncbi:hypothetical protein T439DRAFT_6695 [Meredithblackwellia eburnea MCA 4105]
MPKVTSSDKAASTTTDPSGELNVITSLSSVASDTSTSVTFTRPLAPGSSYTTSQTKYSTLKQAINQPVIYAYGDDNPGNNEASSDIKQHQMDAMGATFVDLSAAFSATQATVSAPFGSITASSTGSTGSSQAGGASSKSGSVTGGSSGSKTSSGSGSVSTSAPTSSTPSSSNSPSSANSSSSSTGETYNYSTLIKYHAVCGALAWLFFAPVAVLIGRLGRSCIWMPWHWSFQVFFTTPLTVTAVGIAVYTQIKQGSTISWDAHKILGISLLIILFVQEAIGLWIHLARMHAKPKERKNGRPFGNWLHIVLGLSVITAGFIQVRLGLKEFGVTNTIINNGYWW